MKTINNVADINIIMGDYFIRRAGFLSRTELARLFYVEFPSERKEKVKNINSLCDVTQTYLDSAIGNRGMLLRKIGELYTNYKDGNMENISYNENILRENISCIINFDYDTHFEKKYNEIVNKITKDRTQHEKGKITLYKIFGDISYPSTMLVSSQDIKKYKLLEMYKPYFDSLYNELYARESYILGLDIKNPDIQEIFTFFLSELDKDKMKKIYYIDLEERVDEEILDILKDLNIEILPKSFIEELPNLERKIEFDGGTDSFDEEIQLKLMDNPIKGEIVDFSIISEIKNEKTNAEKEETLVENSSLEELKETPQEEENFQEETLQEEESYEEKEQISNSDLIKLEPSTPLKYIKIYTAAELKFNSLSLINNPINFSNVEYDEDRFKIEKLNINAVRIGDKAILGTKLRVLKGNGVNFLEIKSREFKLTLSVDITKDKMISKSGEYLKYEIFEGIHYNRFTEIITIFKGLFEGEKLFFKGDGYLGNIILIIEKEKVKFTIIQELNKTFDKLDWIKSTRFNEIKDPYYKLYLLSNLSKGEYETWGNIMLDREAVSNDEIVFEREHTFQVKELKNKILKETININDNLKNVEHLSEGVIYRNKKLKIKLELIEKP